jgi:hypothetical protein
LSSYRGKSAAEKIAEMRKVVGQSRNELHLAEAELAKQTAEATAFEEIVGARLEPLSNELTSIEGEVRLYHEQLERLQNRCLYDEGFPSIDEQLRDINSTVAEQLVSSRPISAAQTDKKQLRKLYHRLARRYHPDLAGQEIDEVQLNDKMALLNDAYSAGSVIEMMALTEFAELEGVNPQDKDHTLELMKHALETELKRIERRKLEIQGQSRNLHNHPAIQLSLQVKLARLNGRNLLGEMAVELERKIELKTAERDRLREQLTNFGKSPTITKRRKQTAPLARRIRARLRRENLPQPIEPFPKPG